jgi:plastocyanin
MKNKYVRAALLVVVLLGAAALVPLLAGNADIFGGSDRGSPVREIHLVAKDMTFYVEGQNSPNPTLDVRLGERIRLVFRNVDPGMSHDFTIRSWSVGTRVLKGKGEDAIEFTVPRTRGAHAYTCTPHSQMMGGTIVVN